MRYTLLLLLCLPLAALAQRHDVIDMNKHPMHHNPHTAHATAWFFSGNSRARWDAQGLDATVRVVRPMAVSIRCDSIHHQITFTLTTGPKVIIYDPKVEDSNDDSRYATGATYYHTAGQGDIILYQSRGKIDSIARNWPGQWRVVYYDSVALKLKLKHK